MFPLPFIGVRKGEIDPTVAIGADAFSGSYTTSYPLNNVSYVAVSHSFTVPNNWKKKMWRYRASVTSSAAYGCIGFNIQFRVNGVLLYNPTMSNTQDSYFRYNSGTLNYSYDVELKANDVVDAIIYISGRNVGGSSPSTTASQGMSRLT